MAKKIMTVESEIKRQLKFSIKRDGRAEGGYYATLCKFRNEIGGTFDNFLQKYPIYTWYKKSEHYNKKETTNRKENKMIQVIDKTNGSVFNVDHPDAIDIETAKTFLEDNLFPYFSPKTNWNDYEFKFVEVA